MIQIELFIINWLEFLDLKRKDSHKITLSNLVLFLLFIKVLILPDLVTAIVFCFAVLNYMHKRYEISKYEIEHVKISDVNMISLQNQIDLIKADHSSIRKTAEEAKELVSQNNIAKGFQRRNQRQ